MLDYFEHPTPKPIGRGFVASIVNHRPVVLNLHTRGYIFGFRTWADAQRYAAQLNTGV